MATRCSIVIRAYNEEEHIGRLLRGVLAQTVRDVDIILVDSGSTDKTVEVASQFPVRIVHIRPEDFSFGYSLNTGCSYATMDYIVIASAHVYPLHRDWLEQLLVPLTSDSRVALTYGRQVGDETTKYSEHQLLAKWFPPHAATTQTHPFCNNANAAIRRNLWESHQYDESLTGLEDIDWAKRMLAMGWRVAYASEAEVVHVHDESSSRILDRYRREAIAFKRIFPHEHFSFGDFCQLTVRNIVNDYVCAVRDSRFIPNLFSIPMFRLMQFWGTYRGFRQRGEPTQQLRERFYYPKENKATEMTPTNRRTDLVINYNDL